MLLQLILSLRLMWHFESIHVANSVVALLDMRGRTASHLMLLLIALVRSVQTLPWDDLVLRCSITSSPVDNACALAQQSLQECDALFGSDEVLLRACKAAACAEGDNHSLERLGTGTASARWSSMPIGSFWFASASRADDIGA